MAHHPLDVLGDVKSKAFRLPCHERVPRHYRLDIEPPAPFKPLATSLTSTPRTRPRPSRAASHDDSGVLFADTFVGRCSITFEVVCPVASGLAARFLVLHTLHLAFATEDVCVEVLPNNAYTDAADASADTTTRPGVPSLGVTSPVIPCVSQLQWAPSETTSLEFATALPNKRGDRFRLHFRQYTGRIYEQSQGLYRSHPDDPLFLTTHLEPANARRLLPCYDEPAFLSVFELSVVTEPGYTAVSNTPFVRAEPILAEDESTARTITACLPTPMLHVPASSTPSTGRRRVTDPGASAGQSSSSSQLATDCGDAPVLLGVRGVPAGLTEPPSTPSAATSGTSMGAAAASAATTPVKRSGSAALAAESDRGTRLRAFVVREEATTRRRCFFEPTPTLHTCIVGFTIGRYVIAERFSKRRGIACRVVVPEMDPLHSAWFALDLLIKALDFFDAFFDYELPLRKIDLVAVDTFDALGMENWGMIVLAKTHMLVNESTPIERRQRITRLVGHEVCHHWFGDWATIQWWQDLWLKEGVCRYLEYFFVDSVSPSWCIWNEFVGSIMDDAILADADPCNTHPVRYCRNAPREIEESFDHISYGKGAAILRMLFSMLSHAQMQKAFHLVLVRYGASSFGLEEFRECVEDAIRPRTRRQRRALPAYNPDTTVLPRSSPQSPLTADAPCHGGFQTPLPTQDEDVESRLLCQVRQVLQMVNICGHPYLLVRDTSTQCAGTPQQPSNDALSTAIYTITQYRSPLMTRETLAAYVHHRQRQRGAIDLLTPPVDEFFGWDPQKVLSPSTPVFYVPLRVMEVHGRLGVCLPPRLESLTGPSSVCAQPNLSGAMTSPFTLTLAAETTTASAGGAAIAPLTSPCSATTPSSAGVTPFVSYFNAGGTGMFTCDYDTATWRRLIEAAPYLSDEDRMSLTVTLARLRLVHIGHLDGESSTADRCTLFPEWLLAVTQSPRLMTSFLWDVVTARLTTLLFLTQNSYCNAGLCELAENILAPLHKCCMLSFFAREKSIVDSFEARVHLTFDSVMKMLFVMALCRKPDYRDEAVEIRRWTFQDLFAGGTASVSTNSSFTAADGGLSNAAVAHNASQHKVHHDSSVSSGPAPDPSPQIGQAQCGSSSSPLYPTAGTGVAHDGISTASFSGGGGNAGGPAYASRSNPPVPPSRPAAADGVFFSSSSLPHTHRRGSTSALLSPFLLSTTRDDVPSVRTVGNSSGTGGGASGAGQGGFMPSANYGHWFEETSINLKRSAHVAVIQTALFYLIELGDLSAWMDVVAVVAHHLQYDVAPLGEALGVPVPTLATLTDHTQRERRSELISDLFVVLLPLVFVLDDERAFPSMASIFRHFSMLDTFTVRVIFRNTRFLTFLLTNRLIKELALLKMMLHVGATLCSNGTVIALFKINLAEFYGTPSEHRDANHLSCSGVGEATPGAAATLIDPALAREINACRQLEFCGPAADSDADVDEEHTGSSLLRSVPATDPASHDDSEDAFHATGPRSDGNGFPSHASPLVAARLPITPDAHSHRRHRNVPESVVTLLDAMEANCVWVDYCCEHFDRFVREARGRYATWVTSTVSSAPSSCLTPLTSEPPARGYNHDEGHANFGGVSI